MTTPNTPGAGTCRALDTDGQPPDPLKRHRLADQIANQLLTARLLGGPVRLIHTHRVFLATWPRLRDLLAEAPTIAASRDPRQVRVARTPSGAVAVIRLHGPDWSLILSGGRPLPDWLLAIHDAYPIRQPHPHTSRGWLNALDLGGDIFAADDLTRMCQRIHQAIDA